MKYFEDFEVGVSHVSEQDYEITRDEIIEFAGNWDPMPFHLDEVVASQTYVGELFASSIHTFAIGVKLAHTIKHEEVATVAGLGWDDVRFHHPVCVGDRLRVRSQIDSKRASNSRPGHGILTSKIEVFNQEEVTVASYKLSSLVLMRPEV